MSLEDRELLKRRFPDDPKKEEQPIKLFEMDQSLLSSGGNDHIPKSEKLARILSLGLAILRSPKVLNTLAVDHFFPHLAQIIFNSLLFHLKSAEKHAKKCIQL